MKPGVTELLIVLAVIILIFGPTQIPKLTKMLGKSVKNLRKGMSDDDDDDSDDDEEDEKKSKDKKSKKKSKKSEEKETSDEE